LERLALKVNTGETQGDKGDTRSTGTIRLLVYTVPKVLTVLMELRKQKRTRATQDHWATGAQRTNSIMLYTGSERRQKGDILEQRVPARKPTELTELKGADE